jgi:hypothetical protein
MFRFLTLTVSNPPSVPRRRVYPYTIAAPVSERRNACQLQRGMHAPPNARKNTRPVFPACIAFPDLALHRCVLRVLCARLF